jgi:Sulfotransferase family
MEYPKLFFLHIPKTAGTTFVDTLASFYPNELRANYIEGLDHDQRLRLGNRSFISGHLFFEEIRRLPFAAEFSQILLLREPYARLASHLRFMDRYATPAFKADYELMLPHLKDVVNRISEVDFECSESLGEFFSDLSPWSRLAFDNSQVRFLVDDPGPHFASKALNAEVLGNAIQRLSAFDYIGTTENIDVFVGQIASAFGFGSNYQVMQSNVATAGRRINYLDPRIRYVMHDFVKYDCRLYDEALTRQNARNSALRDSRSLLSRGTRPFIDICTGLAKTAYRYCTGIAKTTR